MFKKNLLNNQKTNLGTVHQEHIMFLICPFK